MSDGNRYERWCSTISRHSLSAGTSMLVTGSIQMTGHGVHTVSDGNRYERWCSTRVTLSVPDEVSSGEVTNTVEEHVWGQFKDGKMTGKGTYYFANGNKYVGDWVDNNRTGHGVHTVSDGNRYERWCSTISRHSLSAQRSLSGEVTNTVEEHVWGQFKDGKMTGKGTYYYANQQVCWWLGRWQNDRSRCLWW